MVTSDPQPLNSPTDQEARVTNLVAIITLVV